MERKVIDTLILVFFFISIFYLVNNLFFSKHKLVTIETYKTNIESLKKILAREKYKKEILEREYTMLQDLKEQNMEAYIRDYLFMVKPNEQIYLQKR